MVQLKYFWGVSLSYWWLRHVCSLFTDEDHKRVGSCLCCTSATHLPCTWPVIHTGHKMAAFMVLFSWLSEVSVLTNRSRNPLLKYWGSVDKACCVSSVHFPFNVGCCTCIHSHDSIGLQMYPMDKPVRGICLLLSNQDFKEARANSVELADREGTDKDHGSLETLFTKLGFYVILQTDFSAQVRDFNWCQLL